jgi:ABC-type uncharacterized transport system permease subunit
MVRSRSCFRFLGTFALLFANSFGAVATAIALTGSSLNIVPILLFAQIRGDVLGDPHLGYALAFGMIVVTGIANTIYIWLRARSSGGRNEEILGLGRTSSSAFCISRCR